MMQPRGGLTCCHLGRSAVSSEALTPGGGERVRFNDAPRIKSRIPIRGDARLCGGLVMWCAAVVRRGGTILAARPISSRDVEYVLR
jgi:hypothetical protein